MLLSSIEIVSTAVDTFYTVGDVEYGTQVAVNVIDASDYNFLINVDPSPIVADSDVTVTITFSTEFPSLAPTIFQSEAPTTATPDPLLSCQLIKVTHYGNCEDSTQDYIVLVDSDVLALANYLQVQTYHFGKETFRLKQNDSGKNAYVKGCNLFHFQESFIYACNKFRYVSHFKP